IVLGTALFTALALAAGEAGAADACIPAKVREALADCSASAASPAMPAADLLAAAAQLQARTSLGALPGGKRAAQGTGRKLAPRELHDTETKLDAAFHRFLCDDKPGPGDTKAAEQHAEIEYARARLHFVANRFAESATMFRAIALHHADLPVGIHASQLYLESLNVLGGEGATSCYDDMASDVPVFVGLYCKDGKEKVNAEQCGTMNAIQRDILRLHAEQQVKEGEKGGADGRGGSSAYEAGAVSYLQIWERYGRAQCEAKSPGCQRMEEILYNAARAYQAARKSHEAIAVRKVMLEPRYHLDNTELAKKATYEIGGSYQAMAFYEEAASWYEIHADVGGDPRRLPRRPRAAERSGGGAGEGRLSVLRQARGEPSILRRTRAGLRSVAVEPLPRRVSEGRRDPRQALSPVLRDRAWLSGAGDQARAVTGFATGTWRASPRRRAHGDRLTGRGRDGVTAS
ncbi:MAG: hypothetical protein ABI134_26915, partial [Byssovorax sp.]